MLRENDPDTKINVVIASRTEEETHLLRKKLEPLLQGIETGFASERYDFQFSNSRPQALYNSVPGGRTVVILNLNDVSIDSDTADILKMRATGFTGPLIILSKRSVDLGQREILSTHPTLFLVKPYDAQDIVGLIRKYLVCERLESQRFPRYKTHENATIQLDNSPNPSASQVVNLSMGGAYLNFERTPSLRVGDRVKLVMELRQLNRTWVMPAKVVWIRHKGTSGQAGMGIEFVGPASGKKNMMSV